MVQIISGIAIGAGVVSLVWLAVHLIGKNREQQAVIAGLLKRIEDLEATARTRMPHEAKLELMDALAVISRTLEDRSINDAFLKNVQGHIANALEVGSIRQGRRE